MLLLTLPVELILQIAPGLYRRCRDINSFAQTCRDLYIIVDPLLYSLDVKVDCELYSRHSTALHHAAQTGLVRTLQKTFQIGPIAHLLYRISLSRSASQLCKHTNTSRQCLLYSQRRGVEVLTGYLSIQYIAWYLFISLRS